jgi:elongation factor Ts
LVGAYIHPGGRVGRADRGEPRETDFVAKTPEFQQLVKDLAMQVAGIRDRAT